MRPLHAGPAREAGVTVLANYKNDIRRACHYERAGLFPHSMSALSIVGG